MLNLFIMFPTLKRVPALNLGGKWSRKRPSSQGKRPKISALTAGEPVVHNPHGEIKVAFESDGADRLLLASIVAYTIDGQTRCREEFLLVTGEQVVGAMPPIFGERRAAQKSLREE
jgi:hypothetical protein